MAPSTAADRQSGVDGRGEVRSAGVGKFAHRRLNPDTGGTYDLPGPQQIPYEI